MASAGVAQMVPNLPAFAADTNADHADDSKVSAGPCGSLLSRTGTTPDTAKAGAHSMQSPPFPWL